MSKIGKSSSRILLEYKLKREELTYMFL